MLECKGHWTRSWEPKASPLLCDLGKAITFPLVSDVEKAELNDRLNSAPAFYSSKIKLGFYKATHLDIRTGLAKRELGFCPVPSSACPPYFHPSLPSISKQLLNIYDVPGTV